MGDRDIRWIQRFNKFSKSLSQLARFIERGELNEFEKQGLVQAFECNYELAWTTIKDFFEAQGETSITGSRDAFRLAFRRGLIENGEAWMDMIKDRALTTHTYNEEVTEKIAEDIIRVYFEEFKKLHAELESRKKKEEDQS